MGGNTHPKESYTQRKRDYKAKRDNETEKQNEAKNHILSDCLSVSLSLCPSVSHITLVERVCCNEAICNTQLLLMYLKVSNSNISDDVVVVIRCILLPNLKEV